MPGLILDQFPLHVLQGLFVGASSKRALFHARDVATRFLSSQRRRVYPTSFERSPIENDGFDSKAMLIVFAIVWNHRQRYICLHSWRDDGRMIRYQKQM